MKLVNQCALALGTHSRQRRLYRRNLTFQPLRYRPVSPQPTYCSGTLLHYMIIFCKQTSTFVNGKVANSKPKNMDGDTAASNIFSRKTIFFPNSVPGTRETMRISFQTKELPPKFRHKCMICTISLTNSQLSNGDVVKILFYRMQPQTASL